MQGGRDKLGWVRQLVKYTETHPIYIADSASSAVEVLEDGSIQKTVFPSLKPNRREDALLLQQWLADMMAQLTANAPQTPSDQVSTTRQHVTTALLQVCGVHSIIVCDCRLTFSAFHDSLHKPTNGADASLASESSHPQMMLRS